MILHRVGSHAESGAGTRVAYRLATRVPPRNLNLDGALHPANPNVGRSTVEGAAENQGVDSSILSWATIVTS